MRTSLIAIAALFALTLAIPFAPNPAANSAHAQTIQDPVPAPEPTPIEDPEDPCEGFDCEEAMGSWSCGDIAQILDEISDLIDEAIEDMEDYEQDAQDAQAALQAAQTALQACLAGGGVCAAEYQAVNDARAALREAIGTMEAQFELIGVLIDDWNDFKQIQDCCCN